MGQGSVDRTTKEMIAMVVSALNTCDAWVALHTAAQIAEIFMVVGLFNPTHALMHGLDLG